MMGLPTAPPKPTDRRSFEGETVQAEAIAPDVLARIVREAIEDRMDLDQLHRTLVREQVARAPLEMSLDRMTDDWEPQP